MRGWIAAGSLFIVSCSGGSSSPRVATIWSNGSLGCWGDAGDTCDSGGNLGKIVPFQGGGSGAGNVEIADSVTGGTPSLHPWRRSTRARSCTRRSR